MADFWIKVEKGTPDKPEVFEIAEILDIDPDAVVGKLVRVWCWIDSNSENGHIKSVTYVLIDRLTSHKGFAEAMVSVGWLTKDGVPNFDRHLGKSAKKRSNDSERKRKSRESSGKSHAESVTKTGLDKSRVDKILIEENPKDIVNGKNIGQVDIEDIIDDKKTATPAKVKILFNEILGDKLSKINSMSAGRVKHLNARINEYKSVKPFHEITEWEKFFGYLRNQCPFFIGETPGQLSGENSFVPDFDWLMKSDNFAKCIDGKYESR